MPNKTWIQGALSAIVVFVYVTIVAWVVTSSERLFGDAPEFWMPVAMLLLLVLSVAVMGLLIFGRPAYLFHKGQIWEAIKLLFMTLSWLTVIVVIVLAFLLS
jgi:hypothetical protein